MKLWPALLLLASCHAPAILTPPKGPGTEWPCGYNDMPFGGHCVPYDLVAPGPGGGEPMRVPAKPYVYTL